MPPNLLSKSTFPKYALLSPGCSKDSVESKINFAKLSPTVGPNPRATVAQTVVAVRLVPPGHTLDTNPPSPALTIPLQDETHSLRLYHPEGRNQVPMMPYPTGRTIPRVVCRFPHLSLILQMDLDAPRNILWTLGLHPLQRMNHLYRLPHLRMAKPLNLTLTPRERQRQSRNLKHLMSLLVLNVTHLWISRCPLQSSLVNHHRQAPQTQIEAILYLRLLNYLPSTPLRRIQVWQVHSPHSRRATYSSGAHRNAFQLTTSPR